VTVIALIAVALAAAVASGGSRAGGHGGCHPSLPRTPRDDGGEQPRWRPRGLPPFTSPETSGWWRGATALAATVASGSSRAGGRGGVGEQPRWRPTVGPQRSGRGIVPSAAHSQVNDSHQAFIRRSPTTGLVATRRP